MPTKPTAVKRQKGTLQPCRTNFNEPELPPAIPAPPDHLSAQAKIFWGEYGPLLFDMRVLSKADRGALEQLCECHAEVVRLRRRIVELGDTVYETESGEGNLMRRPNPEFAQLSDTERRLHAWYSAFGLTPASRSKVSKIVEKKASKFDKLGPIPIRSAG